LLLGQQKAALAGFGIFQQFERFCRVGEYRLGMAGEIERVPVALRQDPPTPLS